MVGAVLVVGAGPGEGQVIERLLSKRAPTTESLVVAGPSAAQRLIEQRDDWLAFILVAKAEGEADACLAWLQSVRKEFEYVPTLMLTKTLDAELVEQAAELASYTCTTTCRSQVLDGFLRTALETRRVPVFDPDKLAAQAAQRAELRPAHGRVLRGLFAGASPKELAGLLGISPNTYRRYANDILRALGYANTAELVQSVLRQSLPPKTPRPSRPPQFPSDS